jgi:hypothetical protein
MKVYKSLKMQRRAGEKTNHSIIRHLTTMRFRTPPSHHSARTGITNDRFFCEQ